MNAHFIRPGIVSLGIWLALAPTGTSEAATYSGTNAPGTWRDFAFTVGPEATNLSLTVAGNATAYSHLLLKRGSAPSDADTEVAAQLDGQGNALHLELPDLAATNYVVRVRTPAGSTTHAFTLSQEVNQPLVRSAAKPAAKPLTGAAEGELEPAGWHYFQVHVPDGVPGWIVVLNSTNAVDLYVRRGALPDTFTADRVSLNRSVDTIFYSDAEAVAGTYFIGVHVPDTAGSAASFTLQVASGRLSTLVWDPASAEAGTEIAIEETGEAGDYYFKITPQNAAVGLWRTALACEAGEAGVYLSRGLLPSPQAHALGSERPGSDGFVVHSSQFEAGQEWFILVRAAAGARWRLWSGDVFVRNLGSLASDASSGSGPVTVGPEGMLFFQTTVPLGTRAWRLQLENPAQPILVRRNLAPHPIDGYGVRGFDLQQPGQMLVVPDYLVPGGDVYFLGIVGVPGEVASLDSRQHAVTDLGFNAATTVSVTGYGYRTFRVQIPAQQVGWQVKVTPIAGEANLCVRRGDVPNEWNNEAFSDSAGALTDSVALGPPVLGDGTAYVTVYGPAEYTCTLTSGDPDVTDINFSDVRINDDPGLVGWKFYRVANLAQQSGALGWELWLTNQPAGTELAIRRNALPFRRNYRDQDSTYIYSSGYVDEASVAGFLQHPAHQADIWYVGVYSPDEPLGPLTLGSAAITPPTLTLDGGMLSRVDAPEGRWEFFRVDVPAGVLGWDIRLVGVQSGTPQLVVRRGQLPTSLFTGPGTGGNWFYPFTSTTWPIGMQWAAHTDWTDLMRAADGSFEYGRILAPGMGNPLEVGTYYVGVFNERQTGPMTYSVRSRAVGEGLSLPIADLDFEGGEAIGSGLGPREAAYYRVNVPAGTASWRVRLTVTEGDALLVAQHLALPGAQRMMNVTRGFQGGRKLQQSGGEHFTLLPLDGQTNLAAGLYYLAVVGEGVGADPGEGRIGTGPSSYTLESLGALPVTDLGTLDGTDRLQGVVLAPGEVKAFRFTAPPGTPGVELLMEDRVGNPALASAPGLLLPAAERDYEERAFDAYGADGGQRQGRFESTERITLVNLDGVYSVVTKANATAGGPTPASFNLRVRLAPPATVEFDGGNAVVTGQGPGAWRYFRVDVPPDCAGWNVRLTNVTAGQPRIVVRRDLLPNETFTSNGSERPVWWQSPSIATNWPSGYQWAPGKDWTHRSFSADGATNEDGRVWNSSLGNPLEPGTYYVGVLNTTPLGEPAGYTFTSRGIGNGRTIPVIDLAFEGGSTAETQLEPREAAFYRATVPAGTTSWQVKLDAAAGESLLAVHQSVLPCTDDGWYPRVAYPPASGGRFMHQVGNEHFLLLPEEGQELLAAGDYMLAVVSEGESPDSDRIGTNSSRFVLTSVGPLPVDDLGSIGSAEVERSQDLEAGQVHAYRFTVPVGVASVDLRLLDRIGNPVMVVGAGTAWPYHTPVNPDLALDAYGVEGGQPAGHFHDDTVLGIANPAPGIYSLLVKARAPDLFGDQQADASYRLTVRATDTVGVAFDGGSTTVTNQAPGSWQYFVVDVPATAAGWDVRVTEVIGGQPRVVVRRGELPQTVETAPWPWPHMETNWPAGHQIAAGQDWTRRDWSADGAREVGRIVALGLGNPLEPGTYFVGVLNESTDEPTRYRFVSRGIGDGLSLPVVDVAFADGAATSSGLVVRDAAYYRVEVPPGMAGWKVKLTALSGESLLAVQQGAVPGFWVDSYGTVAYPPEGPNAGGRKLQKAGDEQFLLLPREGESTLAAGAYYLAVVGEGVNPANAEHAGLGSSSYRLESLGEVPVQDLGTASAAGVLVPNQLAGGEAAVYRFSVAPGTAALETALLDRAGNPVLALRPGAGLAHYYDWWGLRVLGYYGVVGGHYSGIQGDPSILTVANPAPGTYSLTVKATIDAQEDYPDAGYTLRVRTLLTPEVNFDAAFNTNGLSNEIHCLLADDQRSFFRVRVPDTLHGAPILGWKLEARLQQGNALFRVRRDALPADDAPGQSVFAQGSALIVAPFLTPGAWFVEVLAEGATDCALTSSALGLEREPWAMPASGQPSVTPGLTAPEFADSGIDDDGLPLPGDQGLYLDQGHYHCYAFVVPTNNAGLVRATLEAISGNPDLFLRAGAPPTDSHTASGDAWSPLIERSLVGTTGTEFGNWVPGDGRVEDRLTPGLWYAAVRAVGGANARYRLRFSTGTVQDLEFHGGWVNGQVLAAGDWRYYRVQVPVTPPAQWNLTVTPESGEVETFVRDTIPPGRGFYFDWTPVRDWSSDAKNQGPYPSPLAAGTAVLAVPPVRPGHDYYVGVRAHSDAVFSVSTAAPGSAVVLEDLEFYGGTVVTNLPAHGWFQRRILAPADAVRWRHFSSHPALVTLTLEQGTLPGPDTAHWRSWWENSSLNEELRLPIRWPWVVNQMFFLRATNHSDVAQPVQFTMDGRNAISEDEDEDGLPDGWEIEQFGDIWSQWGEGDADGDGVTNEEEYLAGSDPQNNQTPGRFDAFALSATGDLQLHFTAEPGLRYGVEVSTDLETWTLITVLTNTPGGLWLPETGTTQSWRFFRALLNP